MLERNSKRLIKGSLLSMRERGMREQETEGGMEERRDGEHIYLGKTGFGEIEFYNEDLGSQFWWWIRSGRC